MLPKNKPSSIGEDCTVNHDWQPCFCFDKNIRIVKIGYDHKSLMSSFTFNTIKEAEDYIKKMKNRNKK